MTWSWEDIADDWICGNVVADPAEIVAAFNEAESLLGLKWLEAQRNEPNAHILPGTTCAGILMVVRELRRFAGSPGIDQVIANIRKGKSFARKELSAAYTCAGHDPAVHVEFGEPTRADGRQTVPDLRLRKDSEAWTWVEVSSPDISEAANELTAVMDDLANACLPHVEFGIGAEIFIRRELTTTESALLKSVFHGQMTRMEKPARTDLGFAVIRSGHFEPGTLDWPDAPDSGVPFIGTTHLDAEDRRRPARELLQRHVFSDTRAVNLLRREASQLPDHGPALVMLAQPAMGDWIAPIENALTPDRFKWVSGVALFTSKRVSREGRIALEYAARIIEHQHAQHRLPAWLLNRLCSLST